MPELRQERVSGAAGSAAEACTRRGAARPGAAAKGPPAACKRWRLGARAAALQARPRAGARGCGGRGVSTSAAWATERVRGCAWVWTCVGRSPARPSVVRTPTPPSVAACAAPTHLRVCAATQLARGPGPPGRGPGRKTLPIRGAGGGASGTRLLLLGLSETWCPQGPACVTDLRPGRRGEGLAKCRNLVREPLPLLLPVCTGRWTGKLPAPGVWEQRCRGGRKQVEA